MSKAEQWPQMTLEFFYFFAMPVLYSLMADNMAGVSCVRASIVHQGTAKTFHSGISNKGLGYFVASQRNTS